MPLPLSQYIETPILQELAAVGGTDDVRFLYERLIPYFPSLSDAEIQTITAGEHHNWRKAVQKAGRMLDENNLLKRDRGLWSLTEKGRRAVADELEGFTLSRIQNDTLTHQNIQQRLAEIGIALGFHSQTEFEYYDVVWRETAKSPRLSHVFEVQSKGNIDSAFAKLKRAYDAQRSKPFLVLASERDTNRAHRSLAQEFRELEGVITVLSFAEIRQVHDNLRAIADLLPKFLAI